ncbi:MAG TPA: outer membrane protein assembly factor BamA [Candidatus Methylomirabilis sp.]|nr:outer membrane protein assembly factor BamA [Candidatus Methylomirabilis sp.]
MTSLLRVRLTVLLCACLFLVTPPRGVGAQDQPLVTQIDVVGARKVEEATVRFKLKSRVGDPYSPEVLREDIKVLYSLGYFEDIEVHADIFEGGLKLTFILHEKPSIQSLRIVGYRKLDEDKIRAKIDLVEGGIIPPGGLAKNAEKIRLFYEEEGFYQAKIEGQEERVSPQEVAVTFHIVEGDKFDISDIQIIGNRALTEKEIKSKLQTSELYLFFFGGTLKREELARDLDRIRALYLDNGYLDIAVAEPEIQLDTERKKLRILIRVDEGSQYRIRELTVKGNSLFSEAEIRGLIRSQVGGIFSREMLQRDLVAITDRYAERGYLFADVAPVSDIQPADHLVSLALEITEGRQAFVNRIEITGNVRTRDKVIRREIRLVEGDVFNSRLLQESRQNVTKLGFFEDVKLDTKRAVAEDRVDITVDVKEKPTGAFSIGGGFSSVDGFIGVASITQNNLFGYGKRFSVAGQYGENANRLNVVYTDPHFLDTDFLVEPRIYALQTDYEDLQGFNQDTAGASLTVGHNLFEKVFGTVTYLYERVQIKDLAFNAPLLIRLQAAENGGVSFTSSLIFSVTRDTRDSTTEPTRGLRAQASFQYAGGFLDAESNYTVSTLDLSQYWPLWWKLVGHLRGVIAYGEAFGDTPLLPAQKRYFLGGANTVRGYENFSISPRSPITGGETGGNKAFWINSEILFPLYEPLRLRGVVFLDMGNAFDELQNFSWSVKYGAGFGVRFISPVGAIRLEVGFPLNPDAGDDAYEIIFSAGTPF